MDNKCSKCGYEFNKDYEVKYPLCKSETVNSEEVESLYGIGDIVLTNGQIGKFFEVINIEGDTIWIADGHVQITRNSERLKLICKADNRQDDKVPLIKYWKG